MQRNHYLPLKVIGEHLDAIDRGLEPPPRAGRPHAPSVVAGADPDGSGDAAPPVEERVLLTRDELVQDTGDPVALLRALESHGLVRAQPGSGMYDADALAVVQLALELGEYGLEPRHLRAFRTAADREVGLVEQVVTPMLHHRGGEGQPRADDTARALAALTVRLHTILVRAGVRAVLGGERRG
jgi:hypothetical protein